MTGWNNDNYTASFYNNTNKLRHRWPTLLVLITGYLHD
ncbi:MAG: hypothetical protein LPK11_07430 [Chromatiaceae bacterium]|nr:hypothetical protein [Chromatiaceae bacterium]